MKPLSCPTSRSASRACSESSSQLELRYRATVVVLGQEAAEPACFVRCALERPAEARLEVEKSSGLPLDAGYEPLGVPRGLHRQTHLGSTSDLTPSSHVTDGSLESPAVCQGPDHCRGRGKPSQGNPQARIPSAGLRGSRLARRSLPRPSSPPAHFGPISCVTLRQPRAAVRCADPSPKPGRRSRGSACARRAASSRSVREPRR